MLKIDFSTLDLLKRNHPAWRLLCSDHAPLVASFLHRVFIAPNVRVMPQAHLVEALEDDLYALREQQGDGVFPKPALDYLNDWAANDKGWLRKFYPPGSDEPHFDLTPPTEKAIQWLSSLSDRAFVGTESRLLTLFELLRQVSEGSEADPETRIAELQKRRDAIDAEILQIQNGNLTLLDDTAVKDRFQQFVQIARDLLMDFREVEQNFHKLDRSVREKIALWDGSKGALLEEIMNERDGIENSDQGRSFRAFWAFLMSQQRQEEFTRLLEGVLKLPPVVTMHPDARLRRVHYDWLEAGEHAQRTVALLSQQLRRFLDDKAWLENRRIMDILHNVEIGALAVRKMPPSGNFMEIEESAADIDLPMERPLFTPSIKIAIHAVELETGDADLDMTAIFSQTVIDKRELRGHINQALQERTQISLPELLAEYPLEQGLAELVTYMQLASESRRSVVEEGVRDVVEWRGRDNIVRRAHLPRILFTRRKS